MITLPPLTCVHCLVSRGPQTCEILHYSSELSICLGLEADRTWKWRELLSKCRSSCLCKEARHARKITWSVWLRDDTVVGLVGLYPLALPLLFEMRLCPALLCRCIIWRSQIKGNHHEVKYRPSMRFFPWLWCRWQQVQTLLIFISSFFVTCCWNVNTGELSISTLNALHRSSRPQALLEH